MYPPIFRTALRIPTIAPVPHRSVISLTGSQASDFLNGVLSSAIKSPPRPGFSSFLHAQGRVLYDVFLYTRTDPDGYLIEYDSRPSEATPLLSLLKRYILRSKVKARDASEEYDVWQAWGSDAESTWESPRQWTWARSGAVEPLWNKSPECPWGTKHESIQDRRAVGMGRRLLVKKGSQPQEASTHSAASSDAYTLHRILHGVPEGITDIPPMHAFPMDSNLDVMGAIDFRKGCYVGQELTVRIYHTGVVRKRILPVCIHKPEETPQEVIRPDASAPTFDTNIDIQASVVTSSTTGDSPPTPRPRGTGKLLTSSQGVGLALLRLEHAQGVQDGKLAMRLIEGEQHWAISPYSPHGWPHQPLEIED